MGVKENVREDEDSGRSKEDVEGKEWEGVNRLGSLSLSLTTQKSNRQTRTDDDDS